MRYRDFLGEASGRSYIRAYHGTTHDFDRFNKKAIGKGEGFQSFGYGLYFAENYEVARFYADKIGASKPPEDQHAEVIYEVAIAASPDSFLDYDARLDDQSSYVQRALGEDLYQDEPMLDGQSFYDRFPDNRLGLVARRAFLNADGDVAAFAAALRQRAAQARRMFEQSADYVVAHVRRETGSSAHIPRELRSKIVRDLRLTSGGSIDGDVVRDVMTETDGDIAAFEAGIRRYAAERAHATETMIEGIIAQVETANHSNGRIVKRGLGSHFLDELTHTTGSPKRAAQWLHQRRINGVIYLDDGSRDGSTQPPTRNLVVFDARQVRVVKKTYPRETDAGGPL